MEQKKIFKDKIENFPEINDFSMFLKENIKQSTMKLVTFIKKRAVKAPKGKGFGSFFIVLIFKAKKKTVKLCLQYSRKTNAVQEIYT